MTTVTATKKAERTIVSTKWTAAGVKTVIAVSVEKQLINVRDLCAKLEDVPQYTHFASVALEGLNGILDGGGTPEKAKDKAA